MNLKRLINTLLFFCLLLITVITLSYITNSIWGNPPEREIEKEQFVVGPAMTVAAYGRINNIPPVVLVKIFNLAREADSVKYLKDFSLSPEQLLKRTRVEISQYLEEHSKNPIRYTIHFIVYLVFLAFVFYLLYRSQITPLKQKWLYLAAIIIFGFGFNSNPSPMGPLRDTIALFSNPGDMIHPRLFAILTFLVFVVVANKFICSWVCQVGVLQDFIFRLNRFQKGRNGIFRQFKVPFFITNSIRIIFFIVISVSSFLWAFNVIGRIDPFNVFNPAAAGLNGWIFIVSILFLSLFVYRPWCHLFCPFGLFGWLFEKISIFKITVEYNTCTACGICSDRCPSDVMEAILKGKRTVPDCFSCGTCITECPTGSIKFNKTKRSKPPVAFFEHEILKK
jgi:NAD-dependent dihydropyrimidine dehydrogenase PreA subunit